MRKRGTREGIKMFLLIALCFIIFSLTACALLITILVTQTLHSTNDYIDETLALSTEIAKQTLPSNYHDRLMISDEVTLNEYKTYVAMFDDICVQYELEYLWSVVQDEDGIVRFASGTSTDKQAHQGHAKLLSEHSNQSVYIEVFNSMQPEYHTITDEWGDIRALLVPMVSDNGTAYIIGASKTTASVEAIIDEKLWLIIPLSIGSLIISIILALLLSRFISKPFAKLTYAMTHMRSGKYQVVPAKKGTYELRRLSTLFNQMVASIQEHILRIDSLRQHYDITLESIGDGVIVTDCNGMVTRINNEAQRMTGWTKQNAIGAKFDDIFVIRNEKTQMRCESPVEKVIKNGESIALMNHTELIAKDGTIRSIADSAAPIRNKDGSIVGVVLVFRDNTKEKKHINQIVYFSEHDHLTGLFNRHAFEKKKKELFKNQHLPLSVIVGDVNGLKLVNDVFGHERGDKVLVYVSELLKRHIRPTDVLARWGGDEFVILLPNTTSEQCEDICNSINAAFGVEADLPVQPNISIGFATLSDLSHHIETTHRIAEDMMYRHKLQENNSIRSGIIQSLEHALTAKDYRTEQHALETKTIIEKFAAYSGLTPHMTDQLTLLARLHDIGKIAIDDAILFKPGKLTQEEWAAVKTHPEVGYRIAKSISALLHIADGILFHHERWDGKGYPRGLKGKEIPKTARYVNVIDSYEAMTSERPYKGAMAKEDALAEIERCAGSQFDPEIAVSFIKMMKEL